MFSGGDDFVPVSTLCQQPVDPSARMSEEDHQRCLETREYYVDGLSALCNFILNPLDPNAGEEDRELYGELHGDFDNLDTCSQFLPATRMSNGRVVAEPHLPADYDEIPARVRNPREDQYSNTEDSYDAMISGGAQPVPEPDDGGGVAIGFLLLFSIDPASIETSIWADGDPLVMGDHREPSKYRIAYSAEADLRLCFDYGLFAFFGGEWTMHVASNGADIHTFNGTVGGGIAFSATDDFGLELFVSGRLGYRTTFGRSIYHPSVGETQLGNLNAGMGGGIGFVPYLSDNWALHFRFEGGRILTEDEIGGTPIGLFPLFFNVGVGVSAKTPLF